MKHGYAIDANFNIGKTGTADTLKLNGSDVGGGGGTEYYGSDSIEINDANVISVKNGGITSDKIANEAITSDKLADKAVTADKIADGAVTGDKIAEGSIIANNISNNVINGSKLNNNIYYPYYPIWNKSATIGVIPAYKIKELSIQSRRFFNNNGGSIGECNYLFSLYSDSTVECDIRAQVYNNTRITSQPQELFLNISAEPDDVCFNLFESEEDKTLASNMTKIIANVDKKYGEETYSLADSFPHITVTTNEASVYMVTDGDEKLIMNEGGQWNRSSPRVRKIKINSPMPRRLWLFATN